MRQRLPRLKEFFRSLSPEQREAFAARAGTKPVYIERLFWGHNRASPALAQRLVEASDGNLRHADIAPHIYGGLDSGGLVPGKVSADSDKGKYHGWVLSYRDAY